MKNFITQSLNITPSRHRLIAVVGAGGKTTFIYRLADELKSRGLRVAVTTTTHMAREGMYGFTPLGNGFEGEKIIGFSPEVPRKFLQEYDVVLVEADGSRRLPFKVPAEHEPVLPLGVDLVIGAAGASAIGQPFEKACCRYETACRHFNCAPDEVIKAEHILASLTSDFGQKKGVTCDYRYMISQGDVLTEKQLHELQKTGRKYRENGCILSFRENWCQKIENGAEECC